jgi:predicted RNase H-like nuclease
VAAGARDGERFVKFVPTLADLLADKPDLIAVDMPMGFPAEARPGGRACERAARAALPGKASSVFSAPCRSALAMDEYRDAARVNRAAHGIGLSKQSFNLFSKMRELDALLRAKPGCRIVEAHPELGFARMAGAPVLAAKKTPEGRALRLALLEKAGFPGVAAWLDLFPRKAVAPDDTIDAACVCVAALRIAAGQGECLPPQPEKDAYGIEMAIWR